MKPQDLELARRVSHFVSHFSEEWQEYQDWLRDIVASRSVLQAHYLAWQVTLIFRWRLFYFVVYVTGIICVNRLLVWLQSWFSARAVTSRRDRLVPNKIGAPIQMRSRYLLQRTATLLAVAELTLCGLTALTGIMLAYYYQPAAMGAYHSLHQIVHEVNHGALIYSLHHIAGHGLVVLGLVQLVVLFLGRELLPAWFTGWISGILLTVTTMGLSWTAVLLSWTQTGFWRFKIELNIMESIPLIGPSLRTVIAGGDGISSLTLQHMYTLHSYVLAIAAMFLSLIHLIALIIQEQQWNPQAVRLTLNRCCESRPQRKSL